MKYGNSQEQPANTLFMGVRVLKFPLNFRKKLEKRKQLL
jgi:hypothetical protein